MDVHFNSMKIRFDDLKYITKPIFETTHIRTANLFINLDDLNMRFKNVKSNQEFQCCGAGAFKKYASNVLNLAAHYRQWLHRNGIISRIFIYHTTANGGFTSSALVNNYRSYYLDRCKLTNADCYYVNMTIDNGITLLKDVTDYIEGVYIIDSKAEEPSVIPYLMSQKFPVDWNFILTKDRVELQYVIFDKFSILYPSSRYGARMINGSNLWPFVAEKESVTSPFVDQFDPKLFVAILGIVGNTLRSVPKLKKISWRTIFKYLDDIWEKNQNHSISTIMDELDKMILAKSPDIAEQYVNSTLALSMKARYEAMAEVNIEYIVAQMTDIPDIDSLAQINRDPMILGNYPINLRFLTEQYIKTKLPWEK